MAGRCGESDPSDRQRYDPGCMAIRWYGARKAVRKFAEMDARQPDIRLRNPR